MTSSRHLIRTLFTWIGYSRNSLLVLCLQLKCYSQWRMKAIFSVKMLWFMINDKWIENEFEQPSSERLLEYLHYGFCPNLFNTARKPNFRGQKRQILMQMTNFILSMPHIFICQEKLTAKVSRFVNQNIFEIFVKWHHHSAKSLIMYWVWPEFHSFVQRFSVWLLDTRFLEQSNLNHMFFNFV